MDAHCDFCKKPVDLFAVIEFHTKRGWCSPECFQQEVEKQKKIEAERNAKRAVRYL